MLYTAIDEHSKPYGPLIVEKKLRELHPNISFPKIIKNEHIVHLGYECVDTSYSIEDLPPSPSGRIVATTGARRLPDGSLERILREVEPSAEEIEARWYMLRMERARLLSQTVDRLTYMRWMALSDENKEIAVKFRQDLLDMTKAPTPFGYKFPEVPNFLVALP